ncbi:Hypothetical predicted protein [Paramuricea clavata]|uniref:Uncharacterized protein n=1 Tax=Paramuricea clavata TaxID=317549 RepID=A0A7D9IG18_PARCT|nr:Hypothetical predicted protein [Paramuricea clavata]
MKCKRQEEAEPIEEHDSGFVGPMTLFATFPHNDTFAETRTLKLLPNPTTQTAEIYTFMHNRQDYGVINMEDAKLSAKLRIVTTATANAPAATINACVNMAPLRYGWKTKAVYLNNQLITPQSSKENELEFTHDFLTTVPSEYLDDAAIHLMIRDTPGHMDVVTNLHHSTNATGNTNIGARWRYVAINRAVVHQCIDKLDLLGRVKWYVPTSFDIKVVLTRLEKTKVIYGTAAECALLDLRMGDLKLTMPILKPNAQLSGAINDLMIQKGEECRYYKITHRINEAEVPPVITNASEAYINLRQSLDRRHSEMPCTYPEYVSDYGMIVTDLSPNRDGFSQVLPNSTSGNMSIKIDFANDTTAPQQLICIGEFRNQMSVGFGTQARLKYEV